MVFLLWHLTGSAQDIHFTQFYAAPLQVNPANTGFINGNYRLGINYRAQWPFAAYGGYATFHNYSAFTDFSFMEGKLKGDFMGIGFYALNDQAGDGNLRTLKLNLSYAYHKSFDRLGKYKLSAGVSAAYVLRSIDFQKLYFNNQWTGKDFDLYKPNNEPVSNSSAGYFDVSAGINFHASLSEKYRFGIGASLFHLNKPKDSFYGSQNRIGLRPLTNVSFYMKPYEEFDFSAQLFYSFQKQASESAVSILFGFIPSGSYRKEDKWQYYVGVNYRLKDALSPVAGLRYSETRLLVSYDVTLSNLTAANASIGALELSLTHSGRFKKSGRNNSKVFCPKF